MEEKSGEWAFYFSDIYRLYGTRVLDKIRMAIGVAYIQLHLSKFLVIFLIIISMLPTVDLIYGHLYGNGIQ
jgi:hypothetical protein